MPVHTHKEYKEGKKKKVFSKKNKPEEVKSLPQAPSDNSDKKEIYLLQHPENGVDDKLNFKDELNLNGKLYTRECVNGAVRTSEKVLRDFLISKGYLLIDILQGEQ